MGALPLVLTALALSTSAATQSPIELENAHPGTEPHVWLHPAVPPTRIEGYVSEVSVLPGDDVHFHVSTKDGDRYRIEIYRLGWYGGLGARLVACLPDCRSDKSGWRYGAARSGGGNGVVSAGWPVTDVFSVPESAVSGYYYALLRLTDAGDETGARGWIVFVVRESPARSAQIVVQVPVNTWQAYNPWGGASLYDFNSAGGMHATRVSFDRPLAFTAQGAFDAEYNLVRFLERNGYDVSYQTDADTDIDPNGLLRHRLVIVAGHDEYWTKTMRDAFEKARDSGTNLAFTGSNAAYWQVRYEDDHHTLVGYKELPDPEPNPALKTTLFRALQPPRPECALMGVMHLRLREHQSGPVDYTVPDLASDDRWFKGTGLRPGDRIVDVVGNEWDSLPDPPPPPECVKPDLAVLFHYEGQPADADAVRYTAPSGARVFAGGAQQLSWRLDTFDLGRFGRTEPPDVRFQAFMRNALDDLTRPAAPARVQVNRRASTATIRVLAGPDPRVKTFFVFRHRGSSPFEVDDAGVVRACTTSTQTCVQRRLRPGTYRFAAVAVDQWSTSFATISRPVIVPRADRTSRKRQPGGEVAPHGAPP